MNKYLVSKGTALLSEELVEKYGGFQLGLHQDELLGYWAKLIDEKTDGWNAMGHGLTYDLAIASLYLLIVKNKLPSPPSSFTKTNFYLEN